MWKSVSKSVSSLSKFLSSEALQTQQIRTVFVFKRRYAVPLSKKGHEPQRLKAKHYIYDFVHDTGLDKQPNIDVILTSFVDGLGNAGDTVNVPQNYAYINLLLPRLAVYKTPENVEKYKNILQGVDVVKYSSPSAKKVMDLLERACISIILSKEIPWVLKPWHVRVAFRKIGIVVPEEAIELPAKAQNVKGPDMSLEGKELYVTVTINKTEKVNVRCRLHHWSKDVADRVPHEDEFWRKPAECLDPEFAPILAKLPSLVVKGAENEENIS